MSWKITIFCVLTLTTSLFGQGNNTIKNPEAKQLLDSANYYRLRDPQRTLGFAQSILERFPEKGNENMHTQALLHSANSEKMLSHKDIALDYCKKAIRLAISQDDKEYLVKAYYMTGSVHSTFEQQDSSINYYQRIIDLNPTAPSGTYYLCNSYTQIGYIYWGIGNNEKAEEYLLRGFGCSNDERIRPFTLAPLIQFYVRTGNTKYLTYLDTLSESAFYREASAESLMSHFASFLLLDSSSYDVKEVRLREIYKHATDHLNLKNQVNYGLMLSKHLQDGGRLKDAEELLHTLLEKAREDKSLRFEGDVLQALYANAKTQGKMQDAVKYLELYIGAFETFLTEENRNSINELNARFEAVQKDHQIEQQTVQLEQHLKNQSFLIALLVLAGGISVLIFFILRSRVLSARRMAAKDKLIHDQEKAHLLKEKEFAETTASFKAQEEERNRIARDLHDDIGSALSSIHIYSSVALQEFHNSPESAKEILSKINTNTRTLMENMNDIVWAINAGKEGKMSLEHKLRNYGYELLTPLGISCTYDIERIAEKRLMQMEARKSVLLVIKEAMNNIARHSGASQSAVQLHAINGSLLLQISDNGKGFDKATSKAGNGLTNMQKRTEAIGGSFSVESSEAAGTTILCRLPTANFSDAHVS